MSFSSVSDYELGLDVQVKGLDKVTLQLHGIPDETRAALEIAIRKDADLVLSRARALASGDVINVVSGKYLDSLEARVRSGPDGVFGYVWSDDSDLAAVFEYGATQAPREILPNVAQALRFAGGLLGRISLGTVGMVYAAAVHRPAVTYKPKPIIHEALDELETTIEHDVRSAAHSIFIEHA